MCKIENDNDAGIQLEEKKTVVLKTLVNLVDQANDLISIANTESPDWGLFEDKIRTFYDVEIGKIRNIYNHYFLNTDSNNSLIASNLDAHAMHNRGKLLLQMHAILQQSLKEKVKQLHTTSDTDAKSWINEEIDTLVADINRVEDDLRVLKLSLQKSRAINFNLTMNESIGLGVDIAPTVANCNKFQKETNRDDNLNHINNDAETSCCQQSNMADSVPSSSSKRSCTESEVSLLSSHGESGSKAVQKYEVYVAGSLSNLQSDKSEQKNLYDNSKSESDDKNDVSCSSEAIGNISRVSSIIHDSDCSREISEAASPEFSPLSSKQNSVVGSDNGRQIQCHNNSHLRSSLTMNNSIHNHSMNSSIHDFYFAKNQYGEYATASRKSSPVLADPRIFPGNLVNESHNLNESTQQQNLLRRLRNCSEGKTKEEMFMEKYPHRINHEKH